MASTQTSWSELWKLYLINSPALTIDGFDTELINSHALTMNGFEPELQSVLWKLYLILINSPALTVDGLDPELPKCNMKFISDFD